MGFINPLIKDEITSIESWYVNAYGDYDYITVATNVPCKFNDTPTLSYSDVGVVELSKANAWVDINATIDESYRVTFEGNTYEVLEVQEMYGLDGVMTHKKVLLR